MRRGLFGSLVLTASVTFAAAARAQGANDSPIRIAYRAPQDCPSEDTFVAELTRRAKVLRFAEAGELARVVTVVVESDPERSRARVELTDIDGQAVRREVEATTCAEVVSAIALVAALALEARLEEADEQQREKPRAPEPPPRPEPQAAPTPSGAGAPRPTLRDARSSWWSLGIAGGYATGMAPDGLLLLRAFGGLAFEARWEVRLSASYGSASAVRSDASLRFSAAWARLEGCWLAVRIGARGSLGPCAALEGGALHASGVEQPPRIAVAKSATEPWAAGAALGRIRLTEEMLFVEAQAELLAPLVRHEFVLERPPAQVHEFPVLAVGAALGVGILLE